MNCKVKNIIKNLMPYGVYKLYFSNSSDVFTKDFEDYCNRRSHNEEVNDELILNKSYKQVVSVQGLGHSGSGAVLDVLCEMESCNVLGTDENFKVLGIDHKGAFEVDFLRLAGGLFEFEKYLGSNNVFQNDALINRFISYLNSFKLFREDKNIRELFFDFLYNVIDLKIEDIDGVPYNYHLYKGKTKSTIYFLKSMSVDEYRCMCSSFLSRFFNYINNKGEKDIIVLDQFMADCAYDMMRYEDYVPEIRLILSYRDPRDVYAFASQHNIDWIAHNTIDHFISWYKIITKNIDVNTKNYLIIQFESLIFDYENQIKRIMDYLKLDPKDHNELLKQKFFNPSISKVNVGIWENSPLPKSDFDKIRKELSDFCYDR